MNIPKWAQDLTLNACVKFNKELPDLTWRHGSHSYSSGRCFESGRIVITAGKNRCDAKLTLLHELAHHFLPFGEHHSPKFWDMAFELYKWAKMPLRVCVNRERGYRKESINAYKRIKSKKMGGR